MSSCQSILLTPNSFLQLVSSKMTTDYESISFAREDYWNLVTLTATDRLVPFQAIDLDSHDISAPPKINCLFLADC